MRGFKFIVAAAAVLLCVSSGARPAGLRILYWNIQQGMWSDQGNNYDNFVEFVKSQSPDICVWAEGKTHYKTDTADPYKMDDDLYLPAHWDELAARYGHKYVYVGGERDFYPQVITSKYPIRNVKRIVGDDNVLVCHGCGWATVRVHGYKINFVTVHTWPQKYGFNVPVEKRQESISRHEGDYFRRTEMEYICNETILGHPGASGEYWMMLGDFNSRSRVDNYHYNYADDDTRFLVHDFIREKTPYLDLVALKYPYDFQSTIIGGSRIDFVYMTQPLFSMVKSVSVLREGYPRNYKDPRGLSNFCHPSDHLPILMELVLR